MSSVILNLSSEPAFISPADCFAVTTGAFVSVAANAIIGPIVVIIIVICMIGFLIDSVFGIFFSNDYDANSKSMVQVISELNTDFVIC